LLEAGVRQMLGSVDRGHVFRLIEALAQGDGKTVVETSEGLRRDGLSAASTLQEMTTVLQGMAVLQAVPSRAGADNGADPDAAETARLAAVMPADETQLLYSLCLHGRGELGLAPDEYAALTMVLLRLLAFKPGGAATAEKKTLNESSRPEAAAPRAVPVEAAKPPAPPPAPIPSTPSTVPATRPGHRLPVLDAPALTASVPPRPAAAEESAPAAMKVMAMPVRVQPPAGAREGESVAPSAPIPPSEEGDFWHATVTQMVAAESITALARELALQSQLVARDVDQWLLRVERESLNQPGSRDKLQGALAALGHGVKIAIEIGAVVDSPSRRNKQAAEERQRVAEEAIRNDPEVQSMMRDWDARIVPGTLRPA
jgi:DNA polymerase-3 subunit gamma/tau